MIPYTYTAGPFLINKNTSRAHKVPYKTNIAIYSSILPIEAYYQITSRYVILINDIIRFFLFFIFYSVLGHL